MFGQRLHSFSIKACLENIHISSGCLKKINNLNYLAVNALIELLNYTFYTAHEKDAIALRFSNNSHRTLHIKRVQYGDSAT